MAIAEPEPEGIKVALGHTVIALLDIIAAMHTAVEQLETELDAEFDPHPMASILRSAPGLGAVLGARVLAEVGGGGHAHAYELGCRSWARGETEGAQQAS